MEVMGQDEITMVTTYTRIGLSSGMGVKQLKNMPFGGEKKLDDGIC